jgi:hypothetical protein
MMPCCRAGLAGRTKEGARNNEKDKKIRGLGPTLIYTFPITYFLLSKDKRSHCRGPLQLPFLALEAAKGGDDSGELRATRAMGEPSNVLKLRKRSCNTLERRDLEKCNEYR